MTGRGSQVLPCLLLALTLFPALVTAQAQFTWAISHNWDYGAFFLGYGTGGFDGTGVQYRITPEGGTAGSWIPLAATMTNDVFSSAWWLPATQIAAIGVPELQANAAMYLHGHPTVEFTRDGGTTVVSATLNGVVAGFFARNIDSNRQGHASAASLLSDTTVAGYNLADLQEAITTKSIYSIDVATDGGTTTGDIKRFIVQYGSVGSLTSQQIGFTVNGGTLLGPQVLTGGVWSFTSYHADTTNNFCGMSVTDGTGTTYAWGCTTNSFTGFSDPLSGFAFSQGTAAGDILNVQPFSTQRLNPRIITWTPDDDQVLYTYMLFWGGNVDSTLYERNTRDATTYDLAWSTVTARIATGGSAGLQSGAGWYGLDPCVPMEISLNVSQDASFWYESDPQAYGVWTRGWDQSGVGAIQVETATTGSVSSKQVYAAQLGYENNEKCHEAGIQSVYLSDGYKLWVDGVWMGDDEPAPAVGDRTVINSKIWKITGYYNDTFGVTDRFLGFDFYSGYSTPAYTIGDTLTEQSVDITVNSHIGWIDGQGAGYTQTVTAYAMVPREPILTVGIPRADEAASFFDWFFQPSIDADIYTIRWYNPADYEDMENDITGFFLHSGETYETSTGTNHARGRDSNMMINHLVADQSYDFQLRGYISGFGSTYSGYSSWSTSQSFHTANGVQMSCSQEGNMTLQIEYEALPQVPVHFQFSSSNGTGSTSSSLDHEQIGYLFNSDYYFFKFDYNLEIFPKHEDFYGYPTSVSAWWDADTGSGSPSVCIDGLAITYKNLVNAPWRFNLHGDSTAEGATGFSTETVDLTNKMITSVSLEYSSNGCLSGIQFSEASGTVGDCLGPSATCDDATLAAPTAADPLGGDYYFHVLLAENGDGGSQIHAVETTWAAIDLPTLVPMDRSSGCNLNAYIDWHYIRNSAWWLSYDLQNDMTMCGTQQQVLTDHVSEVTSTLHPDQEHESSLGHNVVYHQLIMRSQDSTSNYQSGTNVEITRSNFWEVAGFCYYDAEGKVSSRYDTMEEDPYKAVGHGQIEFDLVIYSNNGLQTGYYNTPQTKYVGDPVWVLAKTEEEMYNMVVTAHTCWATKSPNPYDSDRWDIEDQTCAVDTTFVRDDPFNFQATRDYDYVHLERWDPNLLDVFHFDAFAWYDSSTSAVSASTVYLHCAIRACPANETTACDVTPAGSCGGVNRARRDTGSAAGGETFNGIASSQPLIILSKRAAEQTLAIDRDPLVKPQGTFMTGVMSMTVTGLLFVALMLTYKIYRARNINYHQLQQGTN